MADILSEDFRMRTRGCFVRIEDIMFMANEEVSSMEKLVEDIKSGKTQADVIVFEKLSKDIDSIKMTLDEISGQDKKWEAPILEYNLINRLLALRSSISD